MEQPVSLKALEMSKLNNVRFDIVLGFDFYDGPENGIAVYPSGNVVRFESIADSKYNCFRCYYLSGLPISFREKVEAIYEVIEARENGRRIVLPNTSSPELEALEAEVASAASLSHGFAIGSPYLEWFKLAPILFSQKAEAMEIIDPIKRYKFAHNILKKTLRE